MIPELGHYALVLALALGLIQSVVPIIGARKHDDALMRLASSTALMQFAFVALSFAALATCYRHFGLLGRDRVRELPFHDAAGLQIQQRVGKSRGLHAAMGPHSVGIRRRRRGIRRQSAGNLEGACAGGAVVDRERLLSFHLAHLEPVSAPAARAVRGPRSQSDFAGPRPRHSSAAALSRLCRLLHRLLLCHRRVDRGPHRRRLGALGAAVDAGRLDVSDARHRDGFVLGLLHARLGRLLVLGSGGECLADAVARRHRAVAFRGGDGKARRAQGLDHPAGDPDVLAVADRHLSGALRRAHLGAFVCQRPDAAACSSSPFWCCSSAAA